MIDDSSFEAFYDAHLARHRNSLNRWIVFIGDHVLLASLLLAVKRPRAGLRTYGSALATLALRAAGYRGYVALEYEGAEDPKTGVPRYLEELKKLVVS